MKTNDIPQFTLMLVRLGELYSKNISELLTDIYWQALKGFELQDVEKALEAHIHNPDCGQYFPKPADVVRFIAGSGETRALSAWAVVEKAIHQVGSYQSIAFDDPLIHIVLEDMGGWIKLCSTTLHELPFRANEFQKRYMGFLNKKTERHPSYLVGITETDNAKNRFEISPPLLIGDPEKAEKVIKSGGGTPLLVQAFSRSIAEIMQLPFAKDEDQNE
jgi:hypothetical protein